MGAGIQGVTCSDDGCNRHMTSEGKCPGADGGDWTVCIGFSWSSDSGWMGPRMKPPRGISQQATIDSSNTRQRGRRRGWAEVKVEQQTCIVPAGQNVVVEER